MNTNEIVRKGGFMFAYFGLETLIFKKDLSGVSEHLTQRGESKVIIYTNNLKQTNNYET